MTGISRTDCSQLWVLYKSDIFIIYYQKQIRNPLNRQYLPQYWLEKGFKGIVVNWTWQSLQQDSLEITLTVP